MPDQSPGPEIQFYRSLKEHKAIGIPFAIGTAVLLGYLLYRAQAWLG